jgi:pimeloyl-ACP methyl ester carboxylesterase
MRETSLEANGLRFALLEDGPREGPLVLCLHGFPDSAWTWRRLLPALAARGYHAVAPFMRGYAPTPLPAEPAYAVATLGRDACALCEAIGARDAVLIGHDWGASAVYAALAQSPVLWRRAVTLAVPPTGAVAVDLFSDEQMRRSWYSFLMQLPVAEELVARDDLAFVDRLWDDWSPGYDAADDVRRAKDALRDPRHLSAAIRYYRDNPSVLRSADEIAAARDAAMKVTRPLLYLHGEQDGCIGADVARAASEYFPAGAEIHFVGGAGHFLHLEQPQVVERLILRFLE